LKARVLLGGPQGVDSPANLIPMYGYPEIEKSAAQKKADEDFIKTASVDNATLTPILKQ